MASNISVMAIQFRESGLVAARVSSPSELSMRAGPGAVAGTERIRAELRSYRAEPRIASR